MNTIINNIYIIKMYYINKRSLFTSYNRLTPFAKVNYKKSLDKNKNWYRGNKNKEYIVGDFVMCRNYTGGDGWVQASYVTEIISCNL